VILGRTLLRRHSVLPGFDLALGFVLPPQHVLGQDTTPAGRSVIVTSTAASAWRATSPVSRVTW